MSGIWDMITGKSAKRQAALARRSQRMQQQQIDEERQRVEDAEAQMAARRSLGAGGGGMLAFTEGMGGEGAGADTLAGDERPSSGRRPVAPDGAQSRRPRRRRRGLAAGGYSPDGTG